jgi:anti-sigma-K factor RskA
LHKDDFENLNFKKNVEDSVLSVEKTSIIAEMDAKLQTVKKEAKIKVLSKTNELNKWRIAALVIAILTLVYLYYALSQKRN